MFETNLNAFSLYKKKGLLNEILLVAKKINYLNSIITFKNYGNN